MEFVIFTFPNIEIEERKNVMNYIKKIVREVRNHSEQILNEICRGGVTYFANQFSVGGVTMF